MKTDKLGVVSCIILAISYLAIGPSYIFMSQGERVVGVGSPNAYYPALLANPTPAYLVYWETTIIGLFGVAVVLSVLDLLESNKRGLLAWVSHLAIFGFAVKALDSLRGITLVGMRAEAWVAGDESTRTAIGTTRLTFDYHAWFSLGAVGAWVLVVSILAMRHGKIPKVVGLAGIALGIGQWIGMAGFSLNSVGLLTCSIAAISLISPIWYTGLAITLVRKNR